jgi:hypothetical protein
MEGCRSYPFLFTLSKTTLSKVITYNINIIYRDYNRAMKTAMRLIEYEKELQTKDVYSLVALACFFNENFKECSKAFVKLERL